MTTSDSISNAQETTNSDTDSTMDLAAQPQTDAEALIDDNEATDDDDSIADYMQQLLSRLQHDDGALASQATTIQVEPTPAPTAETSDEPKPAPVKERTAPAPAPESSDDLEALRELSNGSARLAINTHARCNVVRSAWLKFAVAVVAILVAFPMLLVTETAGAWAYGVGIVAMLVAAQYTVQFVRITFSKQFAQAR